MKIGSVASTMIEESPALTAEDRQIIIDWARTVRKRGPDALRDPAVQGKWMDHDLNGPWAGFRSSSFFSAGRIIYKVFERLVVVIVVRVSTTHDYAAPTQVELRDIRKLERLEKKV